MFLNEQIQDCKDLIESLENQGKISNELIELENNPLFQKIITKGLFQDYVQRLVCELGNHNITSQQNDNIISVLKGIGTLQTYFNSIKIDPKDLKDRLTTANNTLAGLIEESKLYE